MLGNLRAEIARKNLTTRDFAKTLNITAKSVSNKMSGKTEFTRKEMTCLRKEFFPELSLGYLFDDEDEPKAG